MEGEFTFDIPTFNATTAMEFLADRSAARRLYGQLVDGKTAAPVPSGGRSGTLPHRVCIFGPCRMHAVLYHANLTGNLTRSSPGNVYCPSCAVLYLSPCYAGLVEHLSITFLSNGNHCPVALGCALPQEMLERRVSLD